MKKQTIMYNNKKMKLPYTLTAGETSTEMVTRENPFSGQSIQLPEFAAVIYDNVINLNLRVRIKELLINTKRHYWQAISSIDFLILFLRLILNFLYV